MTEPPPPVLPPLSPVASERPTSLTVIAIIGIALGALGILCGTPSKFYMLFVGFGPPNPTIEFIKDNPALLVWTVASTLLSFLLAVACLAGGIGALKLRPWSRWALYAYAIGEIVLATIGVILQVTVMPSALPEQ